MGGRGSIGSFNWGGYFNTQYFADPKENLIGILMKQRQGTDSDNTAWKFRQLKEENSLLKLLIAELSLNIIFWV